MQSKDPHGEFIFQGTEVHPLTLTDFWVNILTGETYITENPEWVHVNCRPIDLQRCVIISGKLVDYRMVADIRNINAIPLFHTSGG